MACYHAIPAYQEGAKVKLWPPLGTANLAIPCGKCIGCLAARAQQWANRASHEASQWEHNTFLTLTYDDDNLPICGHLNPRHLTLFLKRLRKTLSSRNTTLLSDRRITPRYLACGEYGTRNLRPHYHILAFNLGVGDAKKYGPELYESDELRRLWPYGSHKIGPATPGAASYIAQYTLKKTGRLRGREKDAGYNGEGYVDGNGEWHPKPAPFLRASTKPAIGLTWLKKYREDLRQGYLVVDQHQTRIPRAYKRTLETTDPHLLEEINIRTQQHLQRTPNDKNDPARIAAAETIHKNNKLKRETRNL